MRYTLPFRGEWLVMNGGVTSGTSHSWELVAQRFAYDFVVADETDRRHRGSGARPEDYYAYGEPILAPAAGEVVSVRDDVRDAPGVGSGWIDWRCRAFTGNTVTIRHGEGEYSLAAHLQPGSITVRAGDLVQRGDMIGRCGHSGHSTEPHLHFQLQDHPDFFEALGLPVRFADAQLSDPALGEDGYLGAGMRVRPIEPVPGDPSSG